MLPTFKNPALLTLALTHRSYLNEHPEVEPEDNERLEFLGDAVLDFIVANWLFRQHPDFDEGRLTSIRSALVRAEKLSELANKIDLGDHLRLGKGESGSGGRTRQTLLADAFEAVIGALYLDRGMRAVQRWLTPLIRTKSENRRRTGRSGCEERAAGMESGAASHHTALSHHRRNRPRSCQAIYRGGVHRQRRGRAR
jgi:ribonuclease-3